MKVVELVARAIVSIPVLVAWFISGLSTYSTWLDLKEGEETHLKTDLGFVATCTAVGLPPLAITGIRNALLPGINILCALAFWAGVWLLKDASKTQEPTTEPPKGWRADFERTKEMS